MGSIVFRNWSRFR